MCAQLGEQLTVGGSDGALPIAQAWRRLPFGACSATQEAHPNLFADTGANRGQAAVPGMICGPQSHPSPHPRWTWRLCPQHAHDMSWGTGVRETSDLMDSAVCKVTLRGEVVVMVGSNGSSGR